MDRTYLFDIDGVVIKRRGEYFSQKFAREYSLDWEYDVLPFFTTEFKRALIGKSDLQELLPNWLAKWKWKDGVAAFLNYWFDSEKEVNMQVLELIMTLRTDSNQVYLASENESCRASYLMNTVGLKKYFDGAFFSSSLGLRKKDPNFYKTIARKIGIEVKDLVLWDDDPENVAAAKSVEVDAHLYTNYEDLESNIKNGKYRVK